MATLAGKLARLPRVLIASDFDGTLSPLVDEPKAAVIHPAAREALVRLAGLYPRVRLAFLSGRSLADLAPRLPAALGGVILSGNHGLEIQGSGLNFTHPGGRDLRPELRAMAAPLSRICQRIPGARLEDKGLSLTLHYRCVASRHQTALAREISELSLTSGVQMQFGKMIVEFRPVVEWNKGSALRCIIQHLGLPPDAGVYLGDDQTDEDAFLELSERGATLFVGDADRISQAKMNAHDPDDAARFLQKLAEHLSAP